MARVLAQTPVHGGTCLYEYVEAAPPATGFLYWDAQYPGFLQVSYTDFSGNDQTSMLQSLSNGDTIVAVNQNVTWTITGTAFNPGQATFGVTPAQGLGQPLSVYNFRFGNPPAVVPPTKVYPQFRWLIGQDGRPVGFVNMDLVSLIKPTGTGSTIQIGDRAFDVTDDPDTIVGIT